MTLAQLAASPASGSPLGARLSGWNSLTVVPARNSQSQKILSQRKFSSAPLTSFQSPQFNASQQLLGASSSSIRSITQLANDKTEEGNQKKASSWAAEAGLAALLVAAGGLTVLEFKKSRSKSSAEENSTSCLEVISQSSEIECLSEGEEKKKMASAEKKKGGKRKDDSSSLEGLVLFTGNSNKPLAEAICKNLGIELGSVKCSRFADGEVALQFLDSTRGRDVYIIQPTSPPVNENLMELLLMISTCRRASAKKITAVVPYYGYARQDRKLSSRVPISAADVARMIESMGVDRVIAVDLHCGQIQGFFPPRVPVDNLEAQPVGLQYFKKKKLTNCVIVSPDAGGVYRARKFQEGLAAEGFNPALAMIIKQRSRSNEIEKMELVGSVNGSDVIIVDDMVDTAGTLCEAARELRRHGAKRVYAFATHGLFSGPAIDRISKSVLEEVVVTDSVKQTESAANCPKIVQLSIGGLLAASIRRINNKESLHQLFKAAEMTEKP